MAELLGLGLTAATGGLTGIAGHVFGRVMGFFETKANNKHELKLMEFKREENEHKLAVLERNHSHEISLHNLNMDAADRETENERAVIAERGSWAGLAASMEHDKAVGEGSQWVVNTLRLVRPSLTFFLWIIVSVIFIYTKDASIVESAVFSGTAATLWWFGDRQKAGQERRENLTQGPGRGAGFVG